MGRVFRSSVALLSLLALTATASLAQVGNPATATRSEGLPQVTPATTAAPSSPIAGAPPPAHDVPLPVFTPKYPYGAGAAGGAAQAQPRVSTLAQAISRSYETNPRLLAERATVRSADYRYPAARAAYGPRLDARASYTYARDRDEIIPRTFIGDQGFTSTAGLVASLPLFTFGRNRAASGGALAQIAFRRDVLRLTEAEVLLNVVTAYVGVLRDAGGVTIARENVTLLGRQFTDISERFRVREVTSSDLQQVETRLELGRAQLLAAQGQLGASQADFLRFVGQLPGDLEPPNVLPLPVATLPDAYGVADAESPVIRAAQSREKISRAAIAAAKAEFLPRVDLQGNADYGTITDFSDKRRTTRLRGAVTATVPLIDSGARAAQLGFAQEVNEADWRLIESASRDTRAAVASAWNDLAASRASLERYRLATDAAQRAYQGALIQEKAGARTTLDVLDLARDLLNVRTSYNVALANEYLARANLLAAVGRLEAPLLINDMAPYDPRKHFNKVADDSDIPLLTGALSALDGVFVGDLSRDRPITDTAAALATGETVQPDTP